MLISAENPSVKRARSERPRLIHRDSAQNPNKLPSESEARGSVLIYSAARRFLRWPSFLVILGSRYTDSERIPVSTNHCYGHAQHFARCSKLRQTGSA